MVSVAFAIWPYPLTPERPPGATPLAEAYRKDVPIIHASRTLSSKRRASLRGHLTPRWLRYCMATGAGADRNDVHDVSGLSEPHGPDGAMAVGGRKCAQISQPRAPGRLRQTVRAARSSPRTDLADVADLYPPGLRHRQGDGRQSGACGDRGSHLCNPVRFAAAFQEGKFPRAAAHAAGGSDVRPFRDAVARHRGDAAAGSRRLYHRLA